MRHVNIPVFIPHLGCPQKCVFCDQNRISGEETRGSENEIYENALNVMETAVGTLSGDEDAEIAFFGGSFTGIGRELMISLLDAAEGYVKKGAVSGIRLSTRPDYIDREILEILSRYHVGYIEIGVQSTSDKVLTLCRRGHTSEQSMAAMRLIKEYGFKSVGQMMTGLPGSSACDEIKTADDIIACGASAARIYPIVIFPGTELCDMAEAGSYVPLSEDELTVRTADVLERFVRAGIPVIKIGLHSGQGTDSAVGTYHPAMGELAEGLVCFRLITEKAADVETRDKYVTVRVPRGFVSKAVGQHGIYREKLRVGLAPRKLVFRESDDLRPYEFDIITE